MTTVDQSRFSMEIDIIAGIWHMCIFLTTIIFKLLRFGSTTSVTYHSFLWDTGLPSIISPKTPLPVKAASSKMFPPQHVSFETQDMKDGIGVKGHFIDPSEASYTVTYR